MCLHVALFSVLSVRLPFAANAAETSCPCCNNARASDNNGKLAKYFLRKPSFFLSQSTYTAILPLPFHKTMFSASVALRSLASVQARRHVPQSMIRPMSSYILDSFGSSRNNSTQWPITKSNMVFNIVPQGFKYVVERFGKMHSIEDSGWFLAIPLVDQIAYVIDVRERAIDIPPQSAITRDNVSVEVSGNLFVQFVDPERAAYGAFNPLYSVMQVRDFKLVPYRVV